MTERVSQTEVIVNSVMHGLDVYVVGGAVRDALLGLSMQGRGYVVVGATLEAIEARGFRAVGKGFPVFLHPAIHAEYVLTHTERKTAVGYKSLSIYYASDIMLEDDLIRRDLTINVMAQRVAEDDALVGPVIDPYGGQADLASCAFRYVSDAFVKDPVRILRLARSAVHFTDFHVAPETDALMQRIVQIGEVDVLVFERMWQEIVRGLMEAHPQRVFAVLRGCGALVRLLPELDRLWGVLQRANYHPEVNAGVYTMMVIEAAAAMATSLPACSAALVHDLGKGITSGDVLPRHTGHEERSMPLIEIVYQRLRVLTECRELVLVVARERDNIHRCDSFDVAALVRLLERCDVLCKPDRFRQVLQMYETDARGRLGFEDRSYPQTACLLHALKAAPPIDAGAVVKRHTDNPVHIR